MKTLTETYWERVKQLPQTPTMQRYTTARSDDARQAAWMSLTEDEQATCKQIGEDVRADARKEAL